MAMTDAMDLDSLFGEMDAAEAARPVAMPDPLTERQAAFLTSLIRDKHRDESDFVDVDEEWVKGLSKKEASAAIDGLLALPRKPRQPVTAPEGMHRWGGRIFKVQRAVHGSGNLYAKVLEEDPHAASGWTFNYAPGAIRNLSESTRLSLEDAKAFGALYSTCCVCGRTLTDETSIANGIGPICQGRL